MTTLYEMMETKETLRSTQLTAERELLIAVLDRAVLDYHGAKDGLSEEAGEWLFARSDYPNVFSFCGICEQLNLCPATILDKIEHLEISTSSSQGHRWLRSKVQSRLRFVPSLISDKEVA